MKIKSMLATLLAGVALSGAAFANGVATGEEAREVSVRVADQVTVYVSVTYATDDGSLGEPVPGVYVFDARTNRLYGRTNDAGRLDLSVAYGTQLRIVEPIYGQQQHVTEPLIKLKEEPVVWTRPK